MVSISAALTARADRDLELADDLEDGWVDDAARAAGVSSRRICPNSLACKSGGQSKQAPTSCTAAVCVLITLLGLWLSPSDAWAQSGTSDHTVAQYRTLIRQAIDQYDAGNYQEAKVLFTEAHQVSPNARTLRGLGLVAYAMRDYIQAIPYLEGALASQTKPLDKRLTDEVERVIGRARSFVGRVHITLSPQNAQLRANGWDVVPDSEGVIVLNPGVNELVATAPEHQPLTRRVRVEPGASLDLDLALARTDSVAASADANGGSESLTPWLVTGVSAAVAVGGGVLLGVALSQIADVERTDPTTTSWSALAADSDHSQTLSTLGIVMLGAGLAGVATGLTWRFLLRDESAQLSLGVSPNGLQLRGGFL